MNNFYREVSLQDFTYSFIIVYDRDLSLKKFKLSKISRKKDLKIVAVIVFGI